MLTDICTVYILKKTRAHTITLIFIYTKYNINRIPIHNAHTQTRADIKKTFHIVERYYVCIVSGKVSVCDTNLVIEFSFPFFFLFYFFLLLYLLLFFLLQRRCEIDRIRYFRVRDLNKTERYDFCFFFSYLVMWNEIE